MGTSPTCKIPACEGRGAHSCQAPNLPGLLFYTNRKQIQPRAQAARQLRAARRCCPALWLLLIAWWLLNWQGLSSVTRD